MTLAFSSCPNDTFIFHALLHNKIDTEGLTFGVHIADISELNAAAICVQYDVIKISYAAYSVVNQHFTILDAGSAIGHGNGPLLVARRPSQSIGATTTVAIPGEYTTAALLMRKAFPTVKHYVPMLFSDIPAAVKSGDADAGVLIHESRFTYAKQGLALIADMGQWWEQRYGLPIPLGGIVMQRALPDADKQRFARVLRRSVEYGLQNPKESITFVRHYAQELDESVIDKHIKMFVNEYTVSLGEKGRQAIRQLTN
jgi:1,4-dihydroxy-6-naphthoate synthase